MKKLILISLLVIGSLSAQAGGPYYCSPYRSCSSFSFSIGTSFGPYPTWYSPSYYASAYSGPSYYAPSSYAYPSYGPLYGRPNYAVTGSLLGAGIGAIVGNNVHHQTWEGAAIGAGAGLLLGGLAEHRARVREQAAMPVMVQQSPSYIPDPPTVNTAPTAPAAPPVPSAPAKPASAMSGANSLFGR